MTAGKHEFTPTGPQLLEGECLLPTQFWDRTGPALISPEGRLLLAILEEALATYLRYAGATDRRARRLFDEAEQWIFSTAIDWPLSFENICALLSIEPQYVRRGLASSKALRRGGAGAVVRLRRDAGRRTRIAHLRSS